MTVGYKNSSGTDFDSIFEPYHSGDTKAPNFGYKDSSGSDLSNRYEKLSYGSAAPAIGYKDSSGNDVNTYYAAIGTVPPSILYLSNTASSVVSTSNQLIISAPSSETSTTTTVNGSGSNAYGLLESQGGTLTASSIAPAASGRGFLFDSTALVGHTLVSGGHFSLALTLNNGFFATVTIWAVLYKYNGGAYTAISGASGTTTYPYNTKTTNTITITYSGTPSFATGDKLFVHLFAQMSGGISGSCIMYMNGGATEGSLTFPAYSS